MTSIIIDDQDSAITYSGSWFLDTSGKLNNMGNFGPPLFNSLHGTSSTGSLTMEFTGTQIWVTHSNQFANPTGLNITCLIDNEVVPVIVTTVPVNMVLLCSKDGLSDGLHTLVLHAVVTNQETFWFDNVHYVPSAAVSLDGATLFVDHTDSGLQAGLGTGWASFSPGFQTSMPGSSWTYTFTGTSLIYYGFYDPSLPYDAALNTASYTIDGGSPILFNTITDAASRTDKPPGVRYNQILFQTAKLPNTKHTLVVSFHGRTSSTPLTLQFLVIQAAPDGHHGSGSPTTSSNMATTAILSPSHTLSGNLDVTSATIIPTGFSSSLVLHTLSSTATTSSGSAVPAALPSVGSDKTTNPINPAPHQNDVAKERNIYIIVGATVGVITGLAILLLFLRKCRRHNNYRQRLDFLAPEMEEPYVHSLYVSSDSGHSVSVSSSHLNLLPNPSQPYAAPAVELTPDGRRTIKLTGKGTVPMHVATTVVQDEDSGLRLHNHQTLTDKPHIQIVPPTYTAE